MELTRDQLKILSKQGIIEITSKGKPLDPDSVISGPIRFRLLKTPLE